MGKLINGIKYMCIHDVDEYKKKSLNDKFYFTASQLSDSGDHDDAAGPTRLERMIAGFSSLGASIRSSFKFRKNEIIPVIEEGCERANSSNLLRVSGLVATSVAGLDKRYFLEY
jgi:hypothetical protein